MASGELSAEAWLARGTEAYLKRRVTEAVEYFEKAVAVDPDFVQAHLALGVARMTLYQRRPSPVSTYLFERRDISDQELEVHRESEKRILAEQNSTNWPLAEKSLKRANQLDPQNKLVVEYLCSLYYHWQDPLGEEDHMYEAKQWLERLLELQPNHKHANFYCGMILSGKARKLLPNYGRFPPGSLPDPPSLRMRARPLLQEARWHLERALALHGGQTAATHLLDDVASMEIYLVDPEKGTRDFRDKLDKLFRKHLPETANESSGPGPSAPVRESDTITFTLSPEAIAEDRERPFPPNPWRIPT